MRPIKPSELPGPQQKRGSGGHCCCCQGCCQVSWTDGHDGANRGGGEAGTASNLGELRCPHTLSLGGRDRRTRPLCVGHQVLAHARGLIPNPKGTDTEVRTLMSFLCWGSYGRGEAHEPSRAGSGAEGREGVTDSEMRSSNRREKGLPIPPRRAPWEGAGRAHLSAPGRVDFLHHCPSSYTL